MQLRIQGRHLLLTDALHDYTSRRVRFALNRIAHRVKQVFVRFTNVNGPRGGEDKKCQVRVVLASGRALVLEGRDASAYRAIDRTIDRAKRTVKDELDRRRDHRRDRRRWLRASARITPL